MSEEGLSKFEAAVLARKALKERTEAAKQLASEFEDLIPGEQYTLTAEQKELDRVLDGVDILSAYRKWCAKSIPNQRPGQTESIMISCPNPAHPDRHPSAWVNTAKQVWRCASCEIGGDKYDIAAWHFGFSVPDYKQGRTFHDLRESMARDLGYVIENRPGSEPLVYLPISSEDVSVEVSQEPAQSEIQAIREAFNQDEQEEQLATVIPIHPEVEVVLPTTAIDWRNIVEPNTFLFSYLENTSIDDAAEEYHFWNGLLALGMAVGLDVTLYDSRPVYANLLVCILGGTGDRKSRSFSHLKRLMKLAMPSNYSNPNDKGVYMPGALASGEALIGAFSKPIPSPVNPKITGSYGAVKALVEFNELSSLMSRTSRLGATLKDVIMQFADTDEVIATTSVTSGEKRAENPFCSIFTTTQPDSMKDLVKKSDTTSGFLNRWIFATGVPKKKIAIGGAIVDLSEPARLLKSIFTWPPLKGIEIKWSEPAAKRFTDHFHSSIESMQKNNPILGRLDLIEKKLILLFCINEKLEEVPEYVVDRVISLHPYLVGIFLSSAKMAGNHENNDIEEEILRQISLISTSNGGKPVTLSRIKKNIIYKGWDIKKINDIWKIIKEYDEIQEVQVNKGKQGRPSFGYLYKEQA